MAARSAQCLCSRSQAELDPRSLLRSKQLGLCSVVKASPWHADGPGRLTAPSTEAEAAENDEYYDDEDDPTECAHESS